MFDKKLRGSAGEYLVCGVLAQFGWAAGLTRDGLARTDAVAVHAESDRAISLQVKTTGVGEGKPARWRVGEKDTRSSTSDSEWYVFVKLEGDAPAISTFYVVPRDHVAAAVWIAHYDWLRSPEVPVGKRNATLSQAMVAEAVFQAYEGRWDLLDVPTHRAPVLLPHSFRDLAQDIPRVGLPERHPWGKKLPAWSKQAPE